MTPGNIIKNVLSGLESRGQTQASSVIMKETETERERERESL